MKIKGKTLIVILILFSLIVLINNVSASNIADNYSIDDNNINLDNVQTNDNLKNNLDDSYTVTDNTNKKIINKNTKEVKNDSNKATHIALIDKNDNADDGKISINNQASGIIEFNVLDSDNQKVNTGIVNLYNNSKKLIDSIDLSTGNNTFIVNSLATNFQATLNANFSLNYTAGTDYLNSNLNVPVVFTRDENVDTIMTITASNTTVSNKNEITVTLKSADGRPIVNEKIIGYITDKSYTWTTNSNGTYTYKSFSYPLARDLTVTATYPGSVTRKYNSASNVSTTFTISKTDDNVNDYIPQVVYLDNHDDNEDFYLTIDTTKLSEIEFTVVDNNANSLNEGMAALYVNTADKLTTPDQVQSELMGILEQIDVIDLSSDNRTFIFNPYQYNIISNLSTTLTIYHPEINDYRQALATVKTNFVLPEENVQTNLEAITDESNNIIATLTANNLTVKNEEISVVVNNQTYTAITNSEGQAIFTNIPVDENVLNIKAIVSYAGNDNRKLANSTTSTLLNLKMINTSIQLFDIHDNINDGEFRITNEELGLLEFNVVDEENNDMKIGTVYLYNSSNKVIDSIDLSTDNRTFIINSLAINFDSTKSDNYTLRYVGVDEYEDSNVTVPFLFRRMSYVDTVLTITATDSTVRNPNEITVTLKTTDGRPIAYETVHVFIGGNNFKWTTNINGTYTYKSYTYAIPKNLTANATYEGNKTRLYRPANDTANFTVFKTDDNVEDYSSVVVFIDSNDDIEDFNLTAPINELSKIEFRVVDKNANDITEGLVRLYLLKSANLTTEDQVLDLYANFLECVDIIDLSTNNNTFIFNPYLYNITVDKTYTDMYPTYITTTGTYRNQTSTQVRTFFTFPDENVETILELTATDTTVNNATEITATLTTNNLPIRNEEIIITIDGEEYKKVTDSNGQVIINDYTKDSAMENIVVSAVFNGNDNRRLNKSNAETTFNIISNEPKLLVDSVNASVGDTICLKATINSTEVINAGKVVFKVNGKTVKDDAGKIIYVKVVNNTAILNYTMPNSWKKNMTLEAVYSGTSKIAGLRSDIADITISEKSLELTVDDVDAKVGETVCLHASLTDKNINVGKIVFKINGKIVKDENGKSIYATVVNGEVTVNYTIPANNKKGEFVITAIYSSSTQKLENNSTMTISKT